ncbi:MAG: tetratricopeptide repeat protein [Pirellulales bacterium]
MLRFAVAVLLVLLVGAAYLPVIGNGWINYDDDVYVTSNAMVLRGLSTDGVRWAFTTTHGGNWHPVTWLSHMLDAQMFGASPLGPHLVNVGMHAANAVLMFWFLSRWSWHRRAEPIASAPAGSDGESVIGDVTGKARVWAAALAAALFALHPLRVEAVAWGAERKELLASCFAWLTILLYAGYARRTGGSRYALYAASLVCLALGLLAKPILVTIPVLLCLLDYWPLGRRVGIVDKLPPMLLALASAGATIFAQARFGNTRLLEAVPWPLRLANGAIACVTYLRQMLWPTGLAPFYPYPRAWLESTAGVLAAIAAASLLVAITAACMMCRRRYRWLLAGWMWYLVALVPVIGLVQVGRQSHADRYTYFPSIGLAWLAAWSFVLLVEHRAALTRAMAVATSIVVVAWLALLSALQTTYWRDDLTFWKHALAVTRDNEIANQNLGVTYLRANKVDEALPYLEESLRLRPAAETHRNLGLAYESLGQRNHEAGRDAEAARQFAQAEDHFQQSAQLRPDWALPVLNLARLYLDVAAGRLYRPGDAARRAQQAQEIAAPIDANGQITALLLLASAQAAQGQSEAAAATIDRCRAVLAKANPDADLSELDRLRQHYLSGGR